MIESREELRAAFPLSAEFEQALNVAGKVRFAQAFVAARDKVETAYYAETDAATSPADRTRKFMGAMVNPMIGRPIADPEKFYETYGRLMRWAWLSVSFGLYDDEIRAIPVAETRLHAAQTNTIDLAWRPVLHHLQQNPEAELVVEIGTGRGNSIARFASLFPDKRLVSITISPEQHRIAQRLIEEMGLENVKVRLGDIFEERTTADLVGAADAVVAIEVAGHFPPPLKVKGIGLLAQMLKPGAILSMTDSALEKHLNGWIRGYIENQSWYFGKREQFMEALAAAEVEPLAYINYGGDIMGTFPDTTAALQRHYAEMKADFGPMMARLWPQVPKIYTQMMKAVDYVQIVGRKRA